MGQTGVDVIVAGDRMDLGLASEAAKRAGEDDPVMVLVEGAAAQFIVAVYRLSEPFAGEQGLPVHREFQDALRRCGHANGLPWQAQSSR